MDRNTIRHVGSYTAQRGSRLGQCRLDIHRDMDHAADVLSRCTRRTMARLKGQEKQTALHTLLLPLHERKRVQRNTLSRYKNQRDMGKGEKRLKNLNEKD